MNFYRPQMPGGSDLFTGRAIQPPPQSPDDERRKADCRPNHVRHSRTVDDCLMHLESQVAEYGSMSLRELTQRTPQYGLDVVMDALRRPESGLERYKNGSATWVRAIIPEGDMS